MRLFFRLAAVVVVLLSAAAAKADTYSTVVLHINSGRGNFYGLDDYGHASIFDGGGCGVDDPCYLNFLYGKLDGTTTTPPFAVDNGSTLFCNVQASAAFYRVDGIYCNGSKVVVVGYTSATQVRSLLYADGDPLNPFPYTSPTDIHINALGDVIYQYQGFDSFIESFDLTSRQIPEPSSIALLGTGLLGMAGAVQRRST